MTVSCGPDSLLYAGHPIWYAHMRQYIGWGLDYSIHERLYQSHAAIQQGACNDGSAGRSPAHMLFSGGGGTVGCPLGAVPPLPERIIWGGSPPQTLPEQRLCLSPG